MSRCEGLGLGERRRRVKRLAVGGFGAKRVVTSESRVARA